MGDKVLRWAINIGMVAFVLLTTAVLTGFVVYFSWNYVMPAVFGLPPLTLIQAIVLSLLVKALVGKDS